MLLVHVPELRKDSETDLTTLEMKAGEGLWLELLEIRKQLLKSAKLVARDRRVTLKLWGFSCI